MSLVAILVVLLALGLIGYFVSVGLAFGLGVLLVILALVWMGADRKKVR